MNLSDPLQLKEEGLRWIFSMLGALIVYFIVVIIVQNVYHPDIDHLYKIAEQVLADPSQARPEPMEAMLFRLGIITILPSLCLFYILLSKVRLAPALTEKWPFFSLSALVVASVTVLIIWGFSAENTSDNTSRFIPLGTEGINNTNFQFFFNGFFLGNYLWVYVLFIVPLVCGIFFMGLKKYHWEDKKILSISVRLTGYLIITATLLFILLMNTFSFPYSVENRYDFAAVYYSMTQVFAGSPMLVNGFTNTYGLYPHFLAPIFRFTGLSVFTFSLTMSLLQVFSFVLNFYVLKKFTRNRLIAFAGFTTLLFFGYLNRKLLNHFDNYFALFPVRYIIPSVLLFLATRYLSAPSKKIYLVTFFVMASFILWNPEIGITCYLAWIVMNVHRDFYGTSGGVNLRAILTHLITGVGVALVIFYAYKLIIRACFGVWPDLGLLWDTISVFSAVGFGLLPMDMIHPWNLPALIILTGFTYAIAKWHRKQITPKTSVVLLLSLISLGYLLYFQGRSHNSSLSSSMGFCVLLLTILGDELWMVTRKTNDFLFNALFTIFLFLVSFSCIELLYSAPRIAALVSQEEDKNYYLDVQEDIANGKLLIERTSKEREKILVLAQKKHQPLLLDVNKRVSAFNPGSIELFLKTDVLRLEKMIADSSFSIYYEAENIFFPLMSLPYAAMAATYQYSAYDHHTLVWLTKRSIHNPRKTFFDHGNALLYRKYDDDATGTQLRISDAMGIATVSPGSEFSVAALFYNAPQMFPEATIAGNAQDSSGFAIGKVFNSAQYFFSLNGVASTAVFPDNTWTYVVMNVYRGHMDIYRNGMLLLTQVLKEPMRNSEQKLFIGNLEGNNKARFFVGPIAEVNIMNKTLDSNQVRATWAEINEAVNK